MKAMSGSCAAIILSSWTRSVVDTVLIPLRARKSGHGLSSMASPRFVSRRNRHPPTAQRLAHVDRGRMVEAFMGLARDLDIAKRGEQLLVLDEHDAHAQPHAGELAAPGFVLDRLDQAAGDAV